jgi:hypothetical protein
MHDCRKIEERLIDLVFGELNEEQRDQTLAEVEGCERCRKEYQAIEKTLAAFDEVSETLMPGETFWNGYEARLRMRLAADEPPTLRQGWFAGLRNFTTKPIWALSLAALLLIALLMWAFLRPQSEQSPVPQNAQDKPVITEPNENRQENQQKKLAQSSGSDEPQDRVQEQPKNGEQDGSVRPHDANSRVALRSDKAVKGKQTKAFDKTLPQIVADGEQGSAIRSLVDEETLRHFEKAQLLLRAFRNSDASDSAEEIAEDRQRSRDLLFKNVLLRREAEAKGNLAVGQVLNDLEPLLLDIANLPEGATSDDLRAVRERMHRGEIIATLQLYTARPVIARAVTD